MRRSTAQQINLGLAIALLLLIISAVVFHFNIDRLQANEGWVHHTYEVQSTLEATLSTLKDAETGQRGYVITGDERYLEPYQTAIAQLDNHLNRLRSLTSDNPSQQQRLTTVETTIAQRMANIRETIDRRRTQGRIAAEQLILTGRGKALMDSVRQQIATMQAEESRLLTLRQQQSQRSFRQATNSMLIALVLDLLLLALVYLLFRRDRRLRQQETARQQQLMTEIETERNRLETVVRQLPVGTVIADAESGRLILGNQQVQAILGHEFLAVEDIMHYREYGSFHPNGRPYEPNEYPLSRALRTGETVLDEEILYRQQDGSFRVIRLSATPVRDRAAQIVAGVVTFYDITPLRRAQQEVQQLNARLEQRVQERTAQLEEANEELQAFSYSVAHDLRAPLRGMQGFAEALLEDYGDRLDGEGREYAEFIISSAQRLETLIQDLLSYSRISRTDLQLRPIELDAVVAEAIAQLQTEITQTQAQVTVQPNMPAVIGHRSTLVQVVSNLVSNAIKFVADGVTPKVEISAENQGDRVRLWVVDNGIGIEGKYYSRIFRVFERLHGVESYPGTGIGLAIVRKGTERMGGSIGVESEPDAGSRFWIELRSTEIN